ncbi:RNA-directed DNA polymerase, eukaryota, nucleotide-binding alpha-beta plait domain protein [Tanacetum coccineum]|uniref:RNA-directed DNA polymerase, eukaryota, nucleotide-binding alpha-beta plait domain protein n=1 Tax=Tanacetum coccineum TaxID=301880 RepID=A0ABQ5B7F7_9ASTR
MAARGKSTADLLSQISHSLFVTNFPSGCNARQIWDSCKHYKHIVDAFIPSRLSKAGKRFAFVRFVKVENLELLIGNLNTIWMGNHRLRFNLARFQRGDKPPTNSQKGQMPNNDSTWVLINKYYASVLNNKVEGENATVGTPVMVIDEECFIDKNMDLTLVAKIIPWSKDFTVDERVSWVDIEGVPSVAWTSKTFEKIAQRWGELLFIEDPNDKIYGGRDCVLKLNGTGIIMESFKIIIQGRISGVRAREIIEWDPEFIDEDNENDSHSEVECRNTKIIGHFQ